MMIRLYIRVTLLQLGYKRLSLPSDFDEVSCHIVEVHMARNWKQLSANSQQGTKVLNPTICKELNATNNHISLEAESSPVETWD